MIFKSDLDKMADAQGYLPLVNNKGSHKNLGCPLCRKNTAFLYANLENHKKVAACVCGYRKSLPVPKPKRPESDPNPMVSRLCHHEDDPTPHRCLAVRKDGTRCPHSRKDGEQFCGIHLRVRAPKVHRN